MTLLGRLEFVLLLFELDYSQQIQLNEPEATLRRLFEGRLAGWLSGEGPLWRRVGHQHARAERYRTGVEIDFYCFT